MNKIKQLFFFVIRYVYALFSSMYMFVIGFIFSKNRELINEISAHFGCRAGLPEAAVIRDIRFSEFANTKLPVQIVEALGDDGNVSLFELFVLNMFVKMYNPGTIFEIGTFDGRTTMNFAVNSSSGTKIYTIDLPKDKTISYKLPINLGEKFYIDQNITGIKYKDKNGNLLPEANKITQLYGDSAEFDFKPYYNKMDLIFIDGSHSYEYVLNDSKIAFNMLRDKKGVILWHDFYHKKSGVNRALEELQLQNPGYNILHIEGTCLAYLILR